MAKSFASHGIKVEAIDGYAEPDFSKYSNIRFTKVDLNSEMEVNTYLSKLDNKFDISMSFEVAEHLDPAISSPLINWMTSTANVVIFSAAVPGQAGDGHINCRPREFWHREFENKGYMIADTIRGKIRNNTKIARWYRHNITDYYRLETPPKVEELRQIIDRLVSSDSAASSDYYLQFKKINLAHRESEYLNQVLRMQPIRLAFQIRNILKRIIGKPVIKLK